MAGSGEVIEANLRLLLGLHAAITFAAGVVLVVAPAAIPRCRRRAHRPVGLSPLLPVGEW
jgi:hypothetical protein